MIGIINYGLGNLYSIRSIIKHVGGESRIIATPDDIEGIKKFILPGVGAFDHGMQGLKDGKWIDVLNNLVKDESNTMLGICLGMQLMCKASEEGELPGLGWVDGQVVKFSFPPQENLRVPHMGWNTLDINKGSDLFSVNDDMRFYFVHSYHVVCNNANAVTATASYGFNITASFQYKNVYGVQFHPEKSHRFGKDFFKRFISL